MGWIMWNSGVSGVWRPRGGMVASALESHDGPGALAGRVVLMVVWPSIYEKGVWLARFATYVGLSLVDKVHYRLIAKVYK